MNVYIEINLTRPYMIIFFLTFKWYVISTKLQKTHLNNRRKYGNYMNV